MKETKQLPVRLNFQSVTCSDPTIGEITYCNLNHSSNCVVKNGSGRKRNAPIKQRCLEGENDGFTKD